MICDDCNKSETCWDYQKFGKRIMQCNKFTAKEELVFETPYTNKIKPLVKTPPENKYNCNNCTQPRDPKRPWECAGCSLLAYRSSTLQFDGKIHYTPKEK